MRSDAATVAEYLDALPEARRADLVRVRDVVRRNLPPGYVETMRWGMITWEVPLETSGPTYNGKPLMYAALAGQKRHNALYLCGLNCLPGLRERLEAAFAAAGRRLDMGAACLRFRGADDVPLPAIGEAVAGVPVERFIESVRRG